MPEDDKYLNRLIAAIRRIIRSEFPNYTYIGIYEYSIQSASEMKVDAVPTDTTLSLPTINNLPLKSSILGEEVTPTPGKLCHVMFLNGSPSRPIVVSCESNNAIVKINATAQVKIAGGVLPAARATDPILAAGIFAGTIVSGSSKTVIG